MATVQKQSDTIVSHSEPLEELARRHLLLHYSRNGAFGPGRGKLPVIVRGEGPYIWDADGNRFFDALSGLVSSQLGYSYGGEIGAAGAEQLAKLFYAPTWSQAHEPAIELAAALAELAPGDLNQALFTSGGGDSNEALWKIARQHYVANGEHERTKAITRRVAYHGTSLGALALTGVDYYKEPFGGRAIDVSHVSNTLPVSPADAADEDAFCRRLVAEVDERVREEGPETIAMILAEPVQTAGGCITPPAGYWSGLREIADRYGILLCADEVVTAFGRLGHWFGSDRVGAAPDMVSVAKGLSSSYAPLGAVIVSDRIAETFRSDPKRTLLHGLTFGSHPLCTAIALKNLEILEREGVLQRVLDLEPMLGGGLGELQALTTVGDVRGAGFMWSVEFVSAADGGKLDADQRERLLREFLPRRLREAGVITRMDDRGGYATMCVAPPLICDADLLDELIASLGAVVEDADRFVQELTAG